MLFSEKTSGSLRHFTYSDLILYVESLIREVRASERADTSNYSWLKSKKDLKHVGNNIDEVIPIVRKMTPENCAAIAVKLTTLTEDVNLSSTTIMEAFRYLLEEQHRLQILAGSVARVKEKVDVRKRKMNRIHPELSPPGRKATVSFILLD